MRKSIKPVIKWSGSKSRMAFEIAIKYQHNRYFEPFLEAVQLCMLFCVF